MITDLSQAVLAMYQAISINTAFVQIEIGRNCESECPFLASDFCLTDTFSYDPSLEVQSYLEAVSSEYGLRKYISFNNKVKATRWYDTRSVWHVEVVDKGKFECDVLINACGILNNIQWPQVPSLEDFQRQICHTTAWDKSIELDRKRVAIIGAGASAVQLLPVIQDQVLHADMYIRTPSWITLPPIESATGEANPAYSEEEKQRFALDHD